MKKISILSAIALAITAASLTSCRSTRNLAKTPEKSIVVLYDNDVHCGIDGYAYMAGLRDAISDTAYVAMVSSGDFLQGGTPGAISHGQYIADIMKHMHYDALTLGNHEFDYSVPTMIDLLKQIGAPVTNVNLRDMQERRIYAPYVIKKMGNKSIAFIGTTTPTTLDTEAYSFFDKDGTQLYDLAPKQVYQLVQEQVDAVRKQGVNYVVILSHLGESKNDMNVDSHGLIAATNGIDVVLDGHTHSVIPTETVMNKDGKPVLITQTGTKFQNVGKLLITPLGQKSTQLIDCKTISKANPEVQAATDSIKKVSDAVVNRPAFTSDVDLTIYDEQGNQAVRYRETNSGDLVADAYRIITGAEIAITNGGGIRSDVKAGKLTYGDIVSLLPYDNYVSIVEVPGRLLVEVLEGCTSLSPVEYGDFPQVSGIKYTVDTMKKENRVSNVLILNSQTNEYEPVNLERSYKLATIDYCITGGGLQSKLKNCNIIKPSICVYNECLIQFVTEKLGGHIGKEYAEPQGRITIR